MKKKILIGVAIGVIVLLIIGGGLLIYFGKEKNPVKTDAITFKEEYENLNGQVNEANGKKYRSVKLSDDNPFIYKTAEEVSKMIENDETMVIYFGFKTCPWCRSIISTLDQVAHDLEVTQIYYVDVSEIRDTLAVNSKGKVETTKEGSEGYYQLLKLLDNVLADYTLSNASGETVKTNEKRIYAPNVVTVVNGEAKILTSGNAKSQTDAYMELTDKMVAETYDKFKAVLTIYKDADCDSSRVC